jgi:hypothetical protein
VLQATAQSSVQNERSLSRIRSVFAKPVDIGTHNATLGSSLGSQLRSF